VTTFLLSISHPTRLATACLLVPLVLIGCDASTELSADGLLDLRIDASLARYDVARAAILQRVVGDNGTMERAEWEALLTSDLTESDLTTLTARHDAIVEAARLAAHDTSAIDVDAFRKDPDAVTAFCAALPKGAMLHIHPGGTRTRPTVDALLAELDPLVDGPAMLLDANDGALTMLYPAEVAWLETLPVQLYSAFEAADQALIAELLLLPADPPTHDFMRFEALFSLGDALLDQDPTQDEFVSRTTHVDFLNRAASMGVSYVEFTKVVIPPDQAALDQFAQWSQDLESETGIVVRWNLAFVRTLPTDLNLGWAADLIAVLAGAASEVLVGIDLLANETDTPALENAQGIYVPILAAVESGQIELQRTMHAGELGDVRNVRDALIMGTQRIGHGVLLHTDLLTLEYARRKRVPIAINLVSNWRLQVWEDWATHPFLRYLRLGLPVSLSTDDEGMFRTDINNECVVAVTHTDIQYSELAQLSRNSLAGAFMKDGLRQTLAERLDQDLATFETTWVAP
jgi:adenosine deaminase CECR1